LMPKTDILRVPALSEKTFNAFRELIYRETGIYMRENKRILVSNRLRKRIVALGIGSYDEYYEYLTGKGGAARELPHFIDAVSTNETYFFRGDNHFEALATVILPEIYPKRSSLRIWSAGCSTGEEPYTISIIVQETIPPNWGGTVEIVATDINTEVIKRAREGIYRGRTLKFVPLALIDRYFNPRGDGTYQVGEETRRFVRFSVHNLLREEPPGYGFDILFCRNVMIYFDRDTQKRLVDEVFSPVLKKDGYLLIGHSESLIGKSVRFKYAHILKAPIYRRKDDREGGI
jgi:chemotaxis protein methyltransferase CheR